MNMIQQFTATLAACLILIAAILLYFTPTIVAATAHKKNTGAILVLNTCLGWTLLGWVVALVWAVTVDEG